MTKSEMIAKVAANQFNWVRAKNLLTQRGEYTIEVARELGVAVETAEKSRRAADGYVHD
jgi:hypothetical protein